MFQIATVVTINLLDVQWWKMVSKIKRLMFEDPQPKHLCGLVH